jgi:hypothetical protein
MYMFFLQEELLSTQNANTIHNKIHDIAWPFFICAGWSLAIYAPVVPSTKRTVNRFSSSIHWNSTSNHNWCLSYPF